MSTDTVAGTLLASRPEGARGRMLAIDVPAERAALHTAAGQYCAVEYGGNTGWFALASRPGERPFEFYMQPGGGSSEQLLQLVPGATVQIGAPQGQGFSLDRILAGEGPVIVLATGSGLSGVRSTINGLAVARRATRLYVGARHAGDRLFLAEHAGWRAAGFEIIEVLSRPEPTWAGRRGYVQHALAADGLDLTSAWVVACGQTAMQTEAAQIAAAAGLPADRFLTNY